ncbi:MAG: hypothetical protein ACJA2E_000306 [Arenicella sp.]|jgi:hypothetical protein
MKTFLQITVLVSLAALLLPTNASEQEGEVTQWQEIKEIDGEKVNVHVISKPVSTTFDAPIVPGELKTCAINIVTDYWQEDDQIKVETVLENTQCGPSKGMYVVRVRTSNDDGDSNTIKYQEPWSRDNSEAVRSTHTYSMKGDTELIRVRIQPPFHGACICAGKTVNQSSEQTE